MTLQIEWSPVCGKTQLAMLRAWHLGGQERNSISKKVFLQILPMEGRCDGQVKWAE